MKIHFKKKVTGKLYSQFPFLFFKWKIQDLGKTISFYTDFVHGQNLLADKCQQSDYLCQLNKSKLRYISLTFISNISSLQE